MQVSITRSMRGTAFAVCALIAALAAPAAATAAPVTADLHVEAGGTALVPDLSYRTDTATVVTDTRKPACGGSGQSKTIQGPTALGVLADASQSTAAMRPLGISDKFSFGLLVCGVGRFVANDSTFWLYKVNRVSPEVGGEAFKLKRGDQVLWYFSDTAANRNTGDELVIDAPARAQAGSPFKVNVVSYAFNGARKAAAGARLLFRGGETTTDRNGEATVTVADAGYSPLRAGRGSDIPSGIVKVCVGAQLDDCPALRGRRIFGTEEVDSLGGTRGPDVISALGGDDRINVRGGGRDRVRCGAGTDSVRMRKGDRAASDCEVVNGKRRRG